MKRWCPCVGPAVCSVAVVLGCSSDTSPGARPALSIVATVTTSEIPKPAVTSTSGPWKQAAAGDEMSQRRLAELHTAKELLRISDGGPQAATALRAIAHAEDAELVLGELVSRAERAPADVTQQRRVLEVVVAVARHMAFEGGRRGEPLEPSSLRRCLDGLERLSRSAETDARVRVLAANALRGFARSGYFEDHAIVELNAPAPAQKR